MSSVADYWVSDDLELVREDGQTFVTIAEDGTSTTGTVLAVADEQGQVTPLSFEAGHRAAFTQRPIDSGVVLAYADAAGRVYLRGKTTPESRGGSFAPVTLTMQGLLGTPAVPFPNDYRDVQPEELSASVSELIPTQNSLTAKSVNDYRRGRGGFVGEPVDVARHGEKFVILDGHHRVAAAVLEGAATIPVRVIGEYAAADDIKEHAVDDDGYGGSWKTINGRHVFIRLGETPKAALERSLKPKSKEELRREKLDILIDRDRAVSDYIQNTHLFINGRLRGRTEGGYVQTDPLIRSLDKAFATEGAHSVAKEELMRYRFSESYGVWKALSRAKVGTVIEDKAFLSTSSSQSLIERVGQGMDKGVIFTIKMPKGTKYLSGRREEGESILDRSTRLKVRRITKGESVHYVDVTVIGKGTAKKYSQDEDYMVLALSPPYDEDTVEDIKEHDFDPNQPRDDLGRWTDVIGISNIVRRPVKEKQRIREAVSQELDSLAQNPVVAKALGDLEKVYINTHTGAGADPSGVFSPAGIVHGGKNGDYAVGNRINLYPYQRGTGLVPLDAPELFMASEYVGGHTLRGTLRHEVGHLVHWRALPDGQHNADWLKLWVSLRDDPSFGKGRASRTKGWNQVSWYANQNHKEAFAESFAAYTHPKYKAGMLPDKVEAFLDSRIGRTGLAKYSLSDRIEVLFGSPETGWVTADVEEDGTEARQIVPVVKEHAVDDAGKGGVWKTINGRHIFIRDGEDLRDALDRSLKPKVKNDGYSPADPQKLKERGFYLEDWQKNWLERGEVELVDVPISDMFQWEYETPITKEDNKVQQIIREWKEGIRFPVLEGHMEHGKVKVTDGQHRMVAGEAAGMKTMPMVLTKEKGADKKIKALSQVDYTQIKSKLTSLEEQGVKELLAILVNARDKLEAKIRANGKDLGAIIKDLTFPGLPDLRDAFRDILRRGWDAGGADARQEVGDLKQYAEQHDYATPSFTPRAALKWLREKTFWVTDLLDDDVINDTRAALLSGLKVGETTAATVERLWKVFEKYIGDPNVLKDGEPLPPSRLETIVRTNNTDAYNHGRMTEFVRPDMLPFITALRYSAILDSRTTPVCEFLHEKLFTPDQMVSSGLLPGNHFNCRSIIVPIVVGEKVNKSDFITDAEIGKARSLADAKFLAQWDESKHPRDEDGKWTDAGGGDQERQMLRDRFSDLPFPHERVDLPIQPGVRSKNPTCGFGDCTNLAFEDYKRNGGDLYVGYAVRKDRFAEAVAKHSPEDWSMPLEAIPHAWNVMGGKIIDTALGSDGAREHVYIGAAVPKEVLARVTSDKQLTDWESLFPKQNEQRDFYDPDQPRVPKGAEDGGQWTSTGVGQAFKDAPLDGKGAAKWRKKMQEKYDNDPEFRATADAVMLFTQGDYTSVRAMAQQEITGELTPHWKDSFLPDWRNKPLHGSAMSTYKEYFAGQPFIWKGEKFPDSKATWKEAMRGLNNAIRTAAPLDAPIYRGVYGRENIDKLLDMKAGATFDMVGPTSFTADVSVAEKFSVRKARGQRGDGLSQYDRAAVIVVEAGARGVKAAALSPWNQKEVITSGRFKIKRIEEGPSVDMGRLGSHKTSRVVVEQVDTFRNTKK